MPVGLPWRDCAPTRFGVSSGPMDRLLVALGVGVWAVVSTPRAFGILDEGLQGPRDAAWVAVDLAFPVLFVGALRTRQRRRALAFTLGQSVLALALLPLGMPHFEGALLAVVGAQTLLVVSAPLAVAWIALQGGPLFVTILPTHEPLGAAKATGEYLAFSVFAMLAFGLRERERAGRRALLRLQAELLGTRALLRETVALAEQQRIRRELHDALGHHLASAAAHLDAARRGAVGDHLERARLALDALVRESRGVITGEAERVDLEAALGALKGAIPGLRLELRLDGLEDLGPDAAWVIFRAVQEGLTNAHKHGSATEVRVRTRRNGPEIILSIENDGGPAGPVREGIGLRSMRERVEASGGCLEVEPGPPFALVIRLPALESVRPALPVSPRLAEVP